MNSCFCVLAFGVGCLMAFSPEQPSKNAPNDVLQAEQRPTYASPGVKAEGMARQPELADRSVTSQNAEKPVPKKGKEKEAGAKVGPNPDFRNGLIQVQVTGLLGLPQRTFVADKDGQFQPKDTYSGSVRAEGRTLFLDCAGNKEARELVEKTVADLRKHTGYVPNIKLQVKGRLHFPPITVVREVDDKRIEHSDTLLVIVVESVKVVE